MNQKKSTELQNAKTFKLKKKKNPSSTYDSLILTFTKYDLIMKTYFIICKIYIYLYS